jgi:hypothetical protein
MTREERERLARNWAEVIDQLYEVPRPRERRIALVAHHLSRVMFLAWRSKHFDEEEGGSNDERCARGTKSVTDKKVATSSTLFYP